MNTNPQTKKSQDSAFQISPLRHSVGFFGSPNFVQASNQPTIPGGTSESKHGSLLKCRNLEFFSESSQKPKILPPHLCFTSSENNNNSSSGLWSSQNESSQKRPCDANVDYQSANKELRELDYYLSQKLQVLRDQLTTSKKARQPRQDTTQIIANNISSRITDNIGTGLHYEEQQQRTVKAPHLRDWPSECGESQANKCDLPHERTPAFTKECEDLGKHLSLNIEVQRCKYDDNQEPKQVKTMSRLDCIQNPKDASGKDKIDKLIKLIKYGHKVRKIRESNKKKRNFSEQNRRKMLKTSAKKKEKIMDSNDLYSHHQYKPISIEFFDRSLSSPASAPNEVCDYKSDDAIIKKNQDNEMEIQECQVPQTPQEKQNQQQKEMEWFMNESVHDIQMGSSNADKKYGGEKNPIKLSGSFYETPDDRTKKCTDSQILNTVRVSSFENVIPPHEADLCIEKTQIKKSKGHVVNASQLHKWGKMYAQEYEKMCYQAYVEHYSTPQPTNQSFHNEIRDDAPNFGCGKQEQDEQPGASFHNQMRNNVQRRRLMQLNGCTNGTMASSMGPKNLLYKDTKVKQGQNPRLDMQQLAVSRFDLLLKGELDQPSNFNLTSEPQDQSERFDHEMAEIQSTQKKFEDMSLDEVEEVHSRNYEDYEEVIHPAQFQDSKVDTDINHKEDQKVVINGCNQQKAAFQDHLEKQEVQRHLDFEKHQNCEESEEYPHGAQNMMGPNKKYYMPQIPSQNIREFHGKFDMHKNRTSSMNNQNTCSSEKLAPRGHNLDMRVASEQYREKEFEFMQQQRQYRQLHNQGPLNDSHESDPKTPPFAKMSKNRFDESRPDQCTGVGSYMTQHTSNQQVSNFTGRQQMPSGRPSEPYCLQSVSPFNQKVFNSGNRQNYGVSRFIRRGQTPHEQHPQSNFMNSNFMQNNQNSQRKALRSAFNEHRQSGFGATPPASQLRQKELLRQSTSPDIDGENLPPHYQMVRPFDSQNKDMYNQGGYENFEPYQMPNMYKSQTPQRSKMMQTSDEEHQEMIIPKDFSNQKFPQNSFKRRIGNTASSFGSVIGDSQVEPQELSNNPVTRYSDNNRKSWHKHQYIESYKSLLAHREAIRCCPKHGEDSDFDDYKETMAMMAAQAHAYAQSCFMYFQLMARISKSSEEKSYFQSQQAIAGCMVHGPHGSEPVQLPIGHDFGFPPSLAEFPSYDQQAFMRFQEDMHSTKMPPPHLMKFESNESPDKKAHDNVLVEGSQQKQNNDKDRQEAIKSQSKTSEEIKPVTEKRAESVDQSKENQDKNNQRKIQPFAAQDFSEPKPLEIASSSLSSHQKPMQFNSHMPPPGFMGQHHKYQAMESRLCRSQQHPGGQIHQNSPSPYMPRQSPQVGGPMGGFGPQMFPSAFPAHHQMMGGPSRMQQAAQQYFMQQQQMKRNKRNRKCPETMRYLMQEFEKDPTWGKETYQRVARETGLSESQVYKWGWDQKNKKNEDDDEDNEGNDAENQEEDEQENKDEPQEHESQCQEKDCQDNSKKNDLKLQLDLAISQVVINTDELNHGITLPHEMADTKASQQNSGEENKADAKKDKGPNVLGESNKTNLGKRVLCDNTNTEKCSTTFTQTSKQQKKRDCKAQSKMLGSNGGATHNQRLHSKLSQASNANANRQSQENIDPQM